jgi:hypothetical protein
LISVTWLKSGTPVQMPPLRATKPALRRLRALAGNEFSIAVGIDPRRHSFPLRTFPLARKIEVLGVMTTPDVGTQHLERAEGAAVIVSDAEIRWGTVRDAVTGVESATIRKRDDVCATAVRDSRSGAGDGNRTP